MGAALYVPLFFHDFQHHSGSKLKAVLEDEAIRYGLELPDAVHVLLKQLFLLVCHSNFELFFIPADQLY